MSQGAAKGAWTSDIVHIKSTLILRKDRISAEDARRSLATLEMKRTALDADFYEEMRDELSAIIENKRMSTTPPPTISQFDVNLLTNRNFVQEAISSLDSGISETMKKKSRGRPRKAKRKVSVLQNVQLPNSQQSQLSNSNQSQDLFQSQLEIFDDMEICFDIAPPDTLTYHATQDLVPETESQDHVEMICDEIGEVIEETPQQQLVPSREEDRSRGGVEEEEEPDVVGGIEAKLKTMQMTDIQQLGEVIDDVTRAVTDFKDVIMRKAREVLERRKERPTMRIKTIKKYNPFYDETTDVVIVETISENEGVDYLREEKWKSRMATMEYLKRKQRELLNAPQPPLVDWRTIPD